MSEDPLMSPVPEEERAPHHTARGSITAWGVIAGIIPGFILGFAAMIGVTMLADSMSTTSDSVDLLLIAAPALLGLILLAIPATRRAGAGFVAGLAIGSLISAGACIAFIQSF